LVRQSLFGIQIQIHEKTECEYGSYTGTLVEIDTKEKRVRALYTSSRYCTVSYGILYYPPKITVKANLEFSEVWNVFTTAIDDLGNCFL
jgi:hypothetical protein